MSYELDSSNARVGVTGGISVGPVGTVLPTNATVVINAAFAGLGYVSEDGVKESLNRSVTKLPGWQNRAVLRQIITEADVQYSFKLVETKKEVLELYYGTSVKSDGSITIDPGNNGGRKSFVIDVIDDKDLIRIVIPEGEVTELGEQQYSGSELVGYEITIAAYPTKIGTETGSVAKYYSSLATGGGSD